MSHTYEIEIKSLLGTKENADQLRANLKNLDDGLVELGKHSQLNHYFTVTEDDLPRMKETIVPLIQNEKQEALEKILEEGSGHSVRTRDADGAVYFIIKASIGDDSSANGVSRIEFEEKVETTIDELDKLLLDSGLEYQAKWSREREEYKSGDLNITIDKNAGYGYLAEFERVVQDADAVDEIKDQLLSVMEQLGVEELPQDRLERMFAHYNAHWPEYYGTDNIFVIE